MTPEQEQLAQLRHRLLGLMYSIAGDVRNCSKGERAAMTNHYSQVLAEGLAEVEKVHLAYTEFFRQALKAAGDKAKEKK